MGISGSGKTTAAKMLDIKLGKLFPTARHYIFDSKMDGDFDSYGGIVVSNTAPPRPDKNEKYQVWQAIKLIPEEIERWLWQIRHDAPALLLIDELYSLVYGKNIYSDEYNIILKTGRSLPVGTVTCTQELAKIPQNAYKQSVHRLGFYLEGRYDTLIRNDLLKGKVENPLHPYGFYYQHQNRRGEPEYFQDIQTFLRGKRRRDVLVS
jgi:hypothetical protein